MMNLNHMRTDPTRITTSSSTFLDYIVCDTKEKISDTRRSFKGVGLGYGRQLYFQCLLKYMVVCALDNPPQFQASWQQRLFTLDMDSLTTMTYFLFYLSIDVFLVFLYLITDDTNVLLLYACIHKIALTYLFPEQICQRNMLSKMPGV